MEPLPTTQRVWTWLCVRFAHDSTTIKATIFHAIFTLTVFVINLCAFAFGLASFLKFVVINMERALAAVLVMAGVSPIVYGMIVMIFLRHKMDTNIFDELSSIYKAS